MIILLPGRAKTLLDRSESAIGTPLLDLSNCSLEGLPGLLVPSEARDMICVFHIEDAYQRSLPFSCTVHCGTEARPASSMTARRVEAAGSFS